MNSKILIAAIGVLGAIGLHATNASAQATRTWVSGVGDDANPCSRTAPCKTFAGAISKTAAAGFINCLDPGGFGAVTITKEITIDCLSTLGGMLATGGSNGVIINAPAGSRVALRGLSLEGAGTPGGAIGIRILSSAVVQVDQCRIAGFRGGVAAGIRVDGANLSVQLHVKDSHILDNGVAGGASGGGIVLEPTGAINTKVALSRVELRDNSRGIVASALGSSGFLSVAASDVVLASNEAEGFKATSSGGSAFVSVLLDRSFVVNNGTTGVVADGSLAQVLLSNNSIVANATSIALLNGGVIYTYGNNRINANGVDNNPTGTLPLR